MGVFKPPFKGGTKQGKKEEPETEAKKEANFLGINRIRLSNKVNRSRIPPRSLPPSLPGRGSNHGNKDLAVVQHEKQYHFLVCLLEIGTPFILPPPHTFWETNKILNMHSFLALILFWDSDVCVCVWMERKREMERDTHNGSQFNTWKNLQSSRRNISRLQDWLLEEKGLLLCFWFEIWFFHLF